ncbi:MAG: spermidine synthase [Nitriliruptorales bacterium]|nr:spermidine synthase [Nitriliruptorales bacterium]
MLLSALMLFVELALIRWAGSNVVYLSYFSNFVLLGSFLGIGIGFLRAGARVDLFPWAPVALTGLVAFVLVFPVEIDRRGDQLIYFGSAQATGLPTWVTLPVIFLATAAVLATIAEGVARTFAKFAPLEAYRLDIAGSIAGIVGFSALSFMHAPPVVWGVAAAAGFLITLPRPSDQHKAPLARRLPLAHLALAGLVLLLAVESVQPGHSWSPYYKVTATERGEGDDSSVIVDVNGIPHQVIQSTARRNAREPIYFLSYERAPENPLRDVLVVGAGNGSDVAIALQNGAQHVDAVEIDPRLQELGDQLHPERPYADARVEVHITDGRAFLEHTDKRYDLILFALPDSLTLVSGQSSLRLESYLFTTGAMEEAREHLSPGGVFAMYNFYRQDWLIDRLAGTLEQAYGHRPCIDTIEGTAGLALLTTGVDETAVDCRERWSARTENPPPPVDDDYPFLYLREPGLPGFYLLTIALILLASVLLIRAASGPLKRMAPYGDLFFMGVAFLLLETKNVVQFALLFGTTWFVNALVFAGVLLSVYIAVEVARRVRLPRPQVLYFALLAAIAVAFLVPNAALLALSPVPRFIVAVVLAFAPIFLANLVFAQRFADVSASTVAFGANLLGAMIGGLLEYLSLIVGYRPLLLVTAGAYGLAFLLGRRHLARVPVRV